MPADLMITCSGYFVVAAACLLAVKLKRRHVASSRGMIECVLFIILVVELKTGCILVPCSAPNAGTSMALLLPYRHLRPGDLRLSSM